MARSTAVRRERLLPGLPVALAALLVAIALWALAPRAAQLIGGGKPDAISLAYLKLLSAVSPEDGALRMRLARALLETGSWAEASRVLAPLLREGAIEARVLQASCDAARARALPPGSAARASTEEAAAAMIAGLLAACQSGAEPCAALSPLPALALELSRPRLAGEIDERLAALGPEQRGNRLADAGAAFAQAGEPDRAGRLLAEAARDLGGAVGARHALQALSLLLGGRDGDGALAVARQLVASFPAERAVLDTAIELALAHDSLQDARAFADRALALDGSDRAALRRDLDVTLAAGQVRLALPLAQRLVALDPESVQARRTLAAVAEWADRPLLALSQWRWLEARVGDAPSSRATLRLAREAHSLDDVVRVLAGAARSRTLAEAELTELSEALATLKSSHEAGVILQRILALHPEDRRLWELLARTWEQGGELASALGLLEEMERRFGPSAALTLEQAQTLWRLLRPRDALARLRARVEAAAPPDSDQAFWRLYADLAWREEAVPDALRAHQALFRAGALDAGGTERLLLLLREAGHSEAVRSSAPIIWEKLHEPRLLLLAADAMAQEKRYGDAEALLALGAAGGDGALARHELYWLLRAEIARHAGNLGEARRFLNGALALEPRSTPARLELLDLTLAEGNAEELSAMLARLREEADDPAFAALFAVGLDRLGRVEDALAFYEKHARRNSGDLLWLLAWADALDRARRPDAALRLRRHAARHLSQFARAANSSRETPARRAEILMRAGVLARSMWGEGAAAAWLRLLLRSEDPQGRAFALRRASSFQAAHDQTAATLAGGLAGEAGGPVNPDALLASELARGRRRQALALLLARLPEEESTSFAAPASEVSLKGSSTTWGAFTQWETEAKTVLEPFRGLSFDLRAGVADLRLPWLPGGGRATDRRLAVGLAGQSGGDRFALHAGLDLRDGGPFTRSGALLRAGGHLTLALPESFAADLEGELNEEADDSAALRFLGVRDRVGAGLLLSPGGRTRAGVHLNRRRTLLRDGTFLASGWAAAVETEHSLLLRNPGVRVRAQGFWVGNELPPDPSAPFTGFRATRLLAPSFGEAGVGIASAASLGRGVQVTGDLFSGWSWPTDQLALRLQVGFSVKLFRKEELRMGGTYARGGPLRESAVSFFASWAHALAL